jgi:DNA-binding protein HU-beta
MNKEDLVDAISDETQLSKTDSKKFLDALIKIIPRTLATGDNIQLVGLASFSVTERAARKGRNPQTGKEIDIAASKVVKFTAGKALKEAINK